MMGTRKKKRGKFEKAYPFSLLGAEKDSRKSGSPPLVKGKGARLSVQQTVNYFPRHTRSPEDDKDGRVGKGCGNQALGIPKKITILSTKRRGIEPKLSVSPKKLTEFDIFLSLSTFCKAFNCHINHLWSNSYRKIKKREGDYDSPG